MSVALLTGRFLQEYVRRPINLALLVIVPLLFVTLAAGGLADFAEAIGGVGDADLIAAPTAGWAAAFLAGVAGFFHVLGSRSADRRLAAAGLGAHTVVAARLISGGLLSLLAAGAATLALMVRTDVADPVRAVAGTMLFAVIYLAIGAAVGSVVRSDVNGSLVVIFVWMLDVFLGPGMVGGDAWVTRLFPGHFVTLTMLNAQSGHGGAFSDLALAVAWAVGAVVVASVIFGSATRLRGKPGRPRRAAPAWSRLVAGLRYGLRDYRRNLALWVLMVILPLFFISLSFVITPSTPTPVELTDAGTTAVRLISMADVHGALMVPITIAFLTGLAGLFVVQGSLEADSRLALAGFRTREILAVRIGIIGLGGLLTTAVALGVSAFDFSPIDWTWFSIGNVAVALTYGLVGVLVGSLVGKLGGLYLMFLLPFIDIGLAQNIMFSAAPPSWGTFLPGRGAVRVLVDAAFTGTFDAWGSLLLAAGWLAGLAVVSAVLFRRIAEPTRV